MDSLTKKILIGTTIVTALAVGVVVHETSKRKSQKNNKTRLDENLSNSNILLGSFTEEDRERSAYSGSSNDESEDPMTKFYRRYPNFRQ